MGTKSHSPSCPTSSTISRARATTPSSSLATMRAVKPRLTMRRNRVWRGASMLIMEPNISLKNSGRSGMLVPLPDWKSSGWRLASTTSA